MSKLNFDKKFCDRLHCQRLCQNNRGNSGQLTPFPVERLNSADACANVNYIHDNVCNQVRGADGVGEVGTLGKIKEESAH